jgi:hypothetical protein
MDARMEECVNQCLSCYRVCLETVQHCLKRGGKHAEAEHIRLLLDCVDICHTSADFMLRGSPLHVRTCAVCAEACERCAESCESMAGDDDTMRRCAEACRACAESCRTMSAEAKGAAA